MNKEKLTQETIDMMTPDNVHMLYCTINWKKILLGDKRPPLSVDQLDDMWVSYFDTWGMMENQVKDNEDYKNRLVSFQLQLAAMASKIFNLQTFLKEEVGLGDIVEYGIKLAEEGLKQKPFSETEFTEFREQVAEKFTKLAKEQKEQ
jgi:hypothetical protein